jgi:hypothetical protein
MMFSNSVRARYYAAVERLTAATWRRGALGVATDRAGGRFGELSGRGER